MRPIKAISLAPAVNNWLTTSRHPGILHVFEHACNLINERREVLSVVTPQIGNGPFNLVVENTALFSEHLDQHSSIAVQPKRLKVGALEIFVDYAKMWKPRPDWVNLHAQRNKFLSPLLQFPISHSLFPSKLTSAFSSALVNLDIPTALSITRQIAGLGQGLTPAGDDYILGALYAVWIIHPPEIAYSFAKEIVDTAAPSTTSLSAAWLRAAERGEAGVLWHEFFDALDKGENSSILLQIQKLLSVGETSGADALAGFLDTIISFMERETNPCPS